MASISLISESSLPARERGLKPIYRDKCKKSEDVAPRAGAWIETGLVGNVAVPRVVAPRAGAWIETATLQQRER